MPKFSYAVLNLANYYNLTNKKANIGNNEKVSQKIIMNESVNKISNSSLTELTRFAINPQIIRRGSLKELNKTIIEKKEKKRERVKTRALSKRKIRKDFKLTNELNYSPYRANLIFEENKKPFIKSCTSMSSNKKLLKNIKDKSNIFTIKCMFH